jgi:hypothetical protein
LQCNACTHWLQLKLISLQINAVTDQRSFSHQPTQVSVITITVEDCWQHKFADNITVQDCWQHNCPRLLTTYLSKFADNITVQDC